MPINELKLRGRPNQFVDARTLSSSKAAAS